MGTPITVLYNAHAKGYDMMRACQRSLGAVRKFI